MCVVEEYHVHMTVFLVPFFFFLQWDNQRFFLSWFFGDIKGLHDMGAHCEQKKRAKVYRERSRKVAEFSILEVKAMARIWVTTLAVGLDIMCSCKLPNYSLTGTQTATRHLKLTVQ